MKSIALALCFWLLAVILFACAPHDASCLCAECERNYYAERERGMK